MRLFYLLVLSAAILAVAACGTQEGYKQADQNNANRLTQDIVYTIDTRTNICYSWANPGTQNSTRATVPCTTEVLALVPNIPREQLPIPAE